MGGMTRSGAAALHPGENRESEWCRSGFIRPTLKERKGSRRVTKGRCTPKQRMAKKKIMVMKGNAGCQKRGAIVEKKASGDEGFQHENQDRKRVATKRLRLLIISSKLPQWHRKP